jgi:hypothetical protein
MPNYYLKTRCNKESFSTVLFSPDLSKVLENFDRVFTGVGFGTQRLEAKVTNANGKKLRQKIIWTTNEC